MLQAGRSRVPFPMRSLDFSVGPNPSSRTMAVVSTQPLTQISIRNLPGGGGVKGGRRVRLIAVPPYIRRLSKKMWEPRRLTTLWASMASYYCNSAVHYNSVIIVFFVDKNFIQLSDCPNHICH
jgi:hypothetical protein